MKREDLEKRINAILDGAGVPWEAFDGASVLVTGATGLVGFNVIAMLLVGGARCATPPKVYALVRNVEKAQARFAEFLGPQLEFVEGDVTAPVELDGTVDYIVHAAARTDSRGMIEEPLSVISTALDGTKNILEFAQAANVRKVVYVSSMEVYGAYGDETPVTEHDYGIVDPLSIRSSYPESKKMAENMCCAYHSERGVPVCIGRLAQTFGVGIPKGDQRVFAYFTRCALNGENIELATEGLSTRMYVSSIDAAAALLVLLAKGQPGQAYNIANDETYCSIHEMADMVCRDLAEKPISVVVKGAVDGRYPPTHHLKLDTSKVRELGWRPATSLLEMYESIVDEV